MIKKYSELTFTDDFMFCRILENNKELTRQLAEVILGKKISKIDNLKAQQEISDWSDAKGVRFDVYFEDEENNVYDVEIQTYNDGNLAKRSHYYHSMIAVDNINKGETYKNLKNSYVIFICTFDPLKRGLPIYTAQTLIKESPDCEFEDGVTSVFLNCTSRSQDITPELLAFFKYVTDNSPSEGLTNSIENDLLLAKNQKEWRQYYMTLYEIKEHERAEGRAEGRAESLVSMIQNVMKNNNATLEEACRLVGLTKEDYDSAQVLLSGQ